MAFDALFKALASARPIAGAMIGANAGALRSLTCEHLFVVDTSSLRTDPQFATLCVKLGLHDYWRESGLWPACATEVAYDFKAECEKSAMDLGRA